MYLPLHPRCFPLLILLASKTLGYTLVDNFSGDTFFDGWEFYGNSDNLTMGDVWWLNREQAFEQGLVSINGDGNAIIRVDNATEVDEGGKRNSVRLTTQKAYEFGSLWVADIVRLPWGCSVWPALWSQGTEWPQNGEIDIIEGINLMTSNQMAFHTRQGCRHTLDPPNLNQVGVSGEEDCSSESGCTVFEQKLFSFGRDYAAKGGGVWAVQFENSGIFIWFWPRGQVPPSVLSASATPGSTLWPDDWGTPSANFPSTSSCNITEFFGPQKLVLEVTLCGIWAAMPELYTPQCGGSGPTGRCYNDNVVGLPGTRYDNAYFEIDYVRTYSRTVDPASASPSGTATSVSENGEDGSTENSGVSRRSVTTWWGLGIIWWIGRMVLDWLGIII